VVGVRDVWLCRGVVLSAMCGMWGVVRGGAWCMVRVLQWLTGAVNV
jgi:hypothetical protein